MNNWSKCLSCLEVVLDLSTHRGENCRRIREYRMAGSMNDPVLFHNIMWSMAFRHRTWFLA